MTKGRFMTVFMSAPRSIKWDELRTLKQVVDLDQLQKENSRQVLSLWTALTVRGRTSMNYEIKLSLFDDLCTDDPLARSVCHFETVFSRRVG